MYSLFILSGQEFNFIVRNVPARLKEMDISDLLSRLDPDGELRSEAKDKGVTLPDEDVASLRDLGKECDRRTKVRMNLCSIDVYIYQLKSVATDICNHHSIRLQLAPYEAENEKTVFKGNGSKGYNLIKASDLLLDSINLDGTENDASKFKMFFRNVDVIILSNLIECITTSIDACHGLSRVTFMHCY